MFSCCPSVINKRGSICHLPTSIVARRGLCLSKSCQVLFQVAKAMDLSWQKVDSM